MNISLPDARELADDVLHALRLRALHGCEIGFTQADVAALLGVSRETISRWWAAYAAGGVDAVPGDRTGRPVGSGRTLSDDQADRIQRLIDTTTPAAHGIRCPLWSRRAVGELIDKEFQIRMPVRTVGEYLRRWGYTAKRPRRHARDQDPGEVAQWVDRAYPELARKAKAEGAVILWCDEVGVAADAFAGYGYARRGEPATVDVPRPHIRVNMISAIGNGGQVRFMTYQGSMTAAVFLVFLKRLVRGARRKIYLVVDQLRAHHARALQGWLADHKDRIEVVPLPRYAPERNADEYLNNDMKGRVKADGLPDTREELRDTIQAFMRRLSHLSQHVMSYFQHPSVQYAAAV